MKFDIAVFGSAFNPCHSGHLDAISQALDSAMEVVAVPSIAHAFGKKMAPFDLRCAVLEASLQSSKLDLDRVSVSTIEQSLYANSPSAIFTYSVLAAIAEQHPKARIAFVIGPDNAVPERWQSFYRADDIAAQWGIIITQERIKIRSTILRRHIQQGINIDPSLMCTEAQNIIRQSNLYQGNQYAA